MIYRRTTKGLSKKDINYFAETNFRNRRVPFGILREDRLLHKYILGKTGVGKSTLLKNFILNDIEMGQGCCIIDPHDDLVSFIRNKIPESRLQDVIYLDLTNKDLKLRFNPLKRVTYEKRSLVASSILEAFKKLWHDSWGVKLEHLLRMSLLTLLDQRSATLADIQKILLDKDFRRGCQKNIINEEVQLFWDKEYPRYLKNDILPVLNKISSFLVHPILRRVLVENKEDLSLRKLMDERKILLVNLSKGHIGSEVAQVLGALLLTTLSSASFSRVDTLEEKRVPFFAYIDEFHNFTTLSLVNMLSELRKFKVGLCFAHQYLNQIELDIRHAILGNVGTIISFRLGTEDALVMAREMYPVFEVEDFIRLPNFHINLMLMINGRPSRPFSAEILKNWLS